MTPDPPCEGAGRQTKYDTTPTSIYQFTWIKCKRYLDPYNMSMTLLMVPTQRIKKRIKEKDSPEESYSVKEEESYLKMTIFLLALTFDISADWPKNAKFSTCQHYYNVILCATNIRISRPCVQITTRIHPWNHSVSKY